MGETGPLTAHGHGVEGDHHHPAEDGERVAVLLCGYGEVETNDDLAEYNASSLRLLVRKSVPIPEVAIPFLARRLAKKARAEYERANRFVSPHNAIFERQREGLAAALHERYGDRVEVFTALNFCEGFTPEEVLPRIRAAGFERLVVYPFLVVDSVYTGRALARAGEPRARRRRRLGPGDPLPRRASTSGRTTTSGSPGTSGTAWRRSARAWRPRRSAWSSSTTAVRTRRRGSRPASATAGRSTTR